MQRIALLAGWLFAVGAAAGVAILYMERDSLETELTIAREAVETVSREAAALKRQNNALERRIETLESAPQATADDDTEAAAPASGEGLNAASLFGALMNNFDAGTPGEPGSPDAKFRYEPGQSPEDFMESAMKLMQSEAGKEFMGSMMGTVFESQYKDLFDELGLTDEQRRRFIEVHLEQQAKSMESAMGMFSGDFDFEAMQKDQATAEENIRTELAKFLSPSQLERKQAYEAELPIRMMSNMYRGSLRGYDLSPESRALIAGVVAEEEHAEGPDRFLSEEERPEGPDAYDRALERLAGSLSAEEYAEAERFIEQQRGQFAFGAGSFTFASEGESANPFGALFGAGE
ncbi:MAG: hypothetical protein GC168_08865 [Candidatus Hydrogenedens sp.]|nr:hypothetical protein [Candidatus Hydrogenedens sp.]